VDVENNDGRGYEEDEKILREYISVLRKHWWKIAALSLAVGVATLLYMFTKPNLYNSTAVIMPVIEEGKQNPAFGALASMGIAVGGPTKVEDLESLFKSKDLTARVFNRHDHWRVLLGDAFDPATGTVRISPLSKLLGNDKVPKPPGDWDAVRSAAKGMTVATNRKSGTLTLSFESTSAQQSAAILKDYLDEAKTRLQEEAFDRATKNKKFIEEQISKTVDPLNRDRLYGLLGQEVEREMMARNREQFGFKVIDSARAPDRKSGPHRAKTAAVASIAGFIVAAGYLLGSRKKKA
jgi:uncharacterized protein involved in exopolysaccharide biosynthesis